MNCSASIKVRILAAPTPPPPFVGSRFVVQTEPEQLIWGINEATLAEGRESGTVDWGDGTTETVAGITRLTHEYSSPGVYEVRLSDDFATLRMSMTVTQTVFAKTYAPMVLEFHTNAVNLSELLAGHLNNALKLRTLEVLARNMKLMTNNTYNGCAALTGEVSFPYIENLSNLEPFKNCTGLTVIHFSKASEEAITANQVYLKDPTLGSQNARVDFDL